MAEEFILKNRGHPILSKSNNVNIYNKKNIKILILYCFRHLSENINAYLSTAKVKGKNEKKGGKREATKVKKLICLLV